MSDATWEQRMAEQAHARRLTDQRHITEDDPHYGHHTHLRGTGVWCSCGEDFGVTNVAFDADYDPDKISCPTCGERGVYLLDETPSAKGHRRHRPGSEPPPA